MDRAQADEVHRLHREACAQGDDSYIDPQTGLLVLTRVHHIRRGSCCGSGCRHCPYVPRHHKNAIELSGDTE